MPPCPSGSSAPLPSCIADLIGIDSVGRSRAQSRTANSTTTRLTPALPCGRELGKGRRSSRAIRSWPRTCTRRINLGISRPYGCSEGRFRRPWPSVHRALRHSTTLDNGRHPRRPPGRCAHRSRPLPKQRKVVHCEARCDPNDGRDKVGDGASASPAIALGPSEANPPWAPTCTTTDTPLRARFAGANCAASLAIPEWPLDAAVPVSERCPAIGDLIFVTEFVLDALCQP